MVDIHSHFLPSLDDGARTLDEALAMVEMAVADGTTELAATPHCNGVYAFSAERNQALLEEVRRRTHHRIALVAGCDFHLSYENLERLQADPRAFTLNQGSYLLVEFPDCGSAAPLLRALHRLRLNDLVPIITHPERTTLLHEDGLELVRRLVRMGCPVQVTADSLLGRFGRGPQETAERLLAERLVHFVASDAHDTRQRPPRLAPARAWLEERYGAELAEALFAENPRAALESRPLPYFPEPAPPRRRRFWFF